MLKERIFLNWETPCLEAAATEIMARYNEDDTSVIDMSNTLIVLPGSRAGRRLLEILTILAKDRVLIPPRFTTAGSLLEIFFEPPLKNNIILKPATKIAKLLAWTKALNNYTELKKLIPTPPENITAWLDIAESYNKIYEELSSAGLSFQDVIEKLESSGDYNDDERWQHLAKVTSAYQEILSNSEKIDKSTLQAQLEELRFITPTPFEQIFLIATADLNTISKRIISKLEIPTTPFIHAPQQLSDAFDEFGCLNVNYWGKTPIEFKDEQLIIADYPQNQAEIVSYLLKNVPTKEATVAIIDQSLEPFILHELEEQNITARSASGISINTTRPISFLKACKDYLLHHTFNELSAIVRHIDVQKYLIHELAIIEEEYKEYLTALDDYQTEHLQGYLSNLLPDNSQDILQKDANVKIIKTTAIRVNKIKALVDKLLAKFFCHNDSLTTWCPYISQLLLTVFNLENLESNKIANNIIIQACKKINQILEQFISVPNEIFQNISGAEAFNIILKFISSEAIPLEGGTNGVEVLGWLEVHLDDAPFLVVTGFNEEFIPESLNADSFLPNSLRQILGLADNSRRYARDAYVFSAILASRSVYIISGKHSTEDENLLPSRLLLACNKETLTQRCQRFYLSTATALPTKSSTETEYNNYDLWKINPPTKEFLATLPPKEIFSVSEFKAYLTCPYRYYLSYVLKLKCLEDRFFELSGANIGTTLHYVLDQFAASSSANSKDARVIEEELIHIFDEYCYKFYGNNPLAAVKIQLAIIRDRLKKIAEVQAAHCIAGWEIKKHEYKLIDNQFKLQNGTTTTVQGRIDRLDFNPEKNEYLIIDYKTSDTVLRPEECCKAGVWKDLQLPLYKYLAEINNIGTKVRLAYFNLPAKLDKIAIEFLTEDQNKINLDSGIEEARYVAQQILNNVFWPPNKELKYDLYENLCERRL